MLDQRVSDILLCIKSLIVTLSVAVPGLILGWELLDLLSFIGRRRQHERAGFQGRLCVALAGKSKQISACKYRPEERPESTCHGYLMQYLWLGLIFEPIGLRVFTPKGFR